MAAKRAMIDIWTTLADEREGEQRPGPQVAAPACPYPPAHPEEHADGSRQQQVPVVGQRGIHGKGHARRPRQFDFGVDEQLGEARDHPVEEEEKGSGQRDQHDFGITQGRFHVVADLVFVLQQVREAIQHVAHRAAEFASPDHGAVERGENIRMRPERVIQRTARAYLLRDVRRGGFERGVFRLRLEDAQKLRDGDACVEQRAELFAEQDDLFVGDRLLEEFLEAFALQGAVPTGNLGRHEAAASSA